MNPKSLVVPILIIVLGVAWLLNVMEILPGVDWIWTGGLAAAGLLVLAVGGLNKLTLVTGPFLLACSVASFFRQLGKLPLDREVPILTIVLGALMLLAQLLRLPASDIFKGEKGGGKS